MSPAFDSTRQAAAFVLLLAVLLAAPWLAGKTLLPPREQAYTAEGWKWGPYPWIHQQLFEETNDIDIAFLGSSHLMWGVHTPSVQQQLAEHLGHPAVVRSICWAYAGFDALYFFTRDLLDRRQVKILVFYDESSGPHPNPEAPFWFRFGDDAGALRGLPWREQGMYYYAAMVGMPRNLLTLFTPELGGELDRHQPNYYEARYLTPNPPSQLGCVSARMGFDPGYAENPNFTPWQVPVSLVPPEPVVYSPATAAQFQFSSPPVAPWQAHFARLFGELARQHGCRMVMLHLPVLAEKADPVIHESSVWPEALDHRPILLGLPPARLFAGLSAAEVQLLYADPGHFNQNGQEYFTRILTPALLRIYDSPVHD